MNLVQFQFWVLFERSRDIADTWVAHALQFDVVTQGSTLEQAMSNAIDAAATVVEDDIENDRDPYERSAPPEDWEKLKDLLQRGAASPVGDVIKSQARAAQVAMELHLMVRVERVEIEAPRSVQLPPQRASNGRLDLAWAPQAQCA